MCTVTQLPHRQRLLTVKAFSLPPTISMNHFRCFCAPCGPSPCRTWQPSDPAHLPGHTAKSNNPKLEIRHLGGRAATETKRTVHLSGNRVSQLSGQPLSPDVMPACVKRFNICPTPVLPQQPPWHTAGVLKADQDLGGRGRRRAKYDQPIATRLFQPTAQSQTALHLCFLIRGVRP